MAFLLGLGHFLWVVGEDQGKFAVFELGLTFEIRNSFSKED